MVELPSTGTSTKVSLNNTVGRDTIMGANLQKSSIFNKHKKAIRHILHRADKT